MVLPIIPCRRRNRRRRDERRDRQRRRWTARRTGGLLDIRRRLEYIREF
jgi:hypothetical protein